MPETSDKAQTHQDTDSMQETLAADTAAEQSPENGLKPSPEQTSEQRADQSADNGDGSLEITHPDNALEAVVLDDLPPGMQEACARAGWTSLMPVQSLALPYLMDGRDIMIQSRTGSGKTGCYLLPLVPALKASNPATQALVLVPTRELALQVAKQAETLFEGTGIGIAVLYGGVGFTKQVEQLRKGAQLVIGCPGRILDQLLRANLNLDGLRALVFDEADRMLSIGFYPDMKQLQRYLPKRRIYTSLFSATYPTHVLNLAGEFMRDPCMLSLSQKQVYVAEVQHAFCEVGRMDKDRALIRLIEMENPASAIIFCNTKANVHYVSGVLQGFGYNADEISADSSQAEREDVMRRVREGRVRFLVATDVAARGIDIPDLSHVFLYEPPTDHETYIHRAGRTGRANAAGTVISLVDIMERLELDRIARHYSLHLHELPNPTDEEVAKVVSSRLLAQLETRFRSLTSLQKVRTRRYLDFARELATMAEDEESEGTGASLLAMLLDAFHHNSLNELALPKAPRPAPGHRDAGQEEKKHGKKRRSRHKSGRDRETPPEGAAGAGPEHASAMPEGSHEAAGQAEGQSQPEGRSDSRAEGKSEGRKRRRPRRRKGGKAAAGTASAAGATDAAPAP